MNNPNKNIPHIVDFSPDHGLLSTKIWETYLATKNVDMNSVVHSILLAIGTTSKRETEQLTRLHVLMGDEGCGKNRIMDQIISTLQAQNINVFEASCNPTLEAPYQPLLNAFSTHNLLFKNLLFLLKSEPLKPSHSVNSNNNNNNSNIKRTNADFKRHPVLFSYRLREAFSKHIADATKVTPIVLVLRDVEFADVSTLELVFFLCRILEEEHFVVLLSVNMNQVSEYVQREYKNLKIILGKTLELNCNPLSQKEITSLLNSALRNPQIPRSFFDELHQHSDGNLVFIVEVISELVRKGILSRIQDTWTLRKDSDWNSVISVGRVELLHLKMQSLNQSERNILNVMSVSGGPMSESRLARFVNIEPYYLNTLLNGLVQNQFIERRISGKNVFYVFVNYSMQDEIYRNLPQEDREKIHRSIAYDLQSQKNSGVRVSSEQLAYHFLNGKENKRALIYTSLAIANMRRVHCLHQALPLCEFAEAVFNSETFRHIRPVLHKKAEIETLLGEYKSALKSYTQLIPMYRQGRARSLILRKIGESHLQCGDFQKALHCYDNATQQVPKSDQVGRALLYREQAKTHIQVGNFQLAMEKGEKALSLLDTKQPSRHLTLVYNTLAETYVHSGHTDKAIKILRYSADNARKIGDEYELASTLNNLAIVQKLIGQSNKALYQWNECMEIYERVGDVVSLIKTLANMADVFAQSGYYSRSWNFHRRCYELLKRIGDVKGMVTSLCNIGELEYLREDFSASISTLEEGLGYTRGIRSQQDELELLYQIARVLLALNRLNEATDKVEQSIYITEELGQKSKLGRLLLLKSQIFRERHDLPKAQLFLDKARECVKEVCDEKLEIEIELETSRLMLDHDQAENAHKTIKSTLAKMEKTGYRTAQIRGLTLLAESDIMGKTETSEVDSSLSKAKQIAEPMKLSLELKRILHLRGQVSINRGEVMQAYDSYKTAYQHLKAITTSITRKDHQSAFLKKAENQKLLKDIYQLQELLKSRHST